MTTDEVVPLLKHTPSAQDPSVLEAITVQREPLIRTLVESVLDTEGGLRHHLLIGPRGMGKTHILSLVASRTRADKRFGQIVLAWLDEDPWAVRTYGKFLAAIVAQVAEETDDPDLAQRATDLRSSADTDGLAGQELLRGALGERRLVLLVENLDDIFRRIGPDGQAKFRAFAEDWRQMLILATAPQLFEGIQRHSSPFYGFFAITHLDELSLTSAAELMKRVAELRGNFALLEFLGTDTATRRLATIEALAGGHPRIWLLFAGCLSIAAIDELVPLFLEALDELTPYYQDRLRELGDQQQELIVLLSEDGGALSNRELAERSGIAQNQIASMLRQLMDRGYVRHAEVSDELSIGDERKSFWELREPLMRLCLDVKQARGKPLRMVVEFLRAWYGPRLLDELARLPDSAELATTYASEAFLTFDGALSPDDLFRGSSDEILARAERGLSLLPERSDLKIAKATALQMEDRFEEARDLYMQLIDPESHGAGNTALRLQLAISQKALDEPIDSETLLADLRELRRAKPDDLETVVFVAIAFGVLDLQEETLEAYTKAVELDPDRADLHRSRGVALEALDRYEEALETHTRAAELEPDNPRIQSRRAIVLGHLDRHEEALEGFTKAAELDPGNARLHSNRGIALRRLDRHEEALAAFTKAARLDPENAAFQERRGVALGRLDRPEEALEAYTRAIELKPTGGNLHNNRGASLGTLGRYEEAIEAFARAAELEPDHAGVFNNLGAALRSLGRYEEALAAFEKAAELEPDNTDAHGNRGVELGRLERDEESLEAFARAAQLAPDDASVQSNHGVALGRVGRYDEALEAFARAAELEPDNAPVHANRGTVLRHLGRDEEALEAYAHAVELEPDNIDLHIIRAAALGDLERHEEALEAFTRAAELKPDDADIRINRGVALANLDRPEDALVAFREAAAVDSDNVFAHERRGAILETMERHEEALEAFARAAEVSPQNPSPHNSRANILRELGRYDEAAEAARHAIELDDQEPVFRFTLAEALLAHGRIDDGLSQLNQALARWQSDRKSPPGETDLLCRILWERFHGDPARAELIARVVATYADAGAAEELGRGIVSSIALFAAADVGIRETDSWVEDWTDAPAVAELEIPLNVLEAARKWKHDKDRAHLLALPSEQREILIGLLTPSQAETAE